MDFQDMPSYKDIAPRLVGLREALNFTREALADKLGLKPEVVAGYEQGDREIPVSFLMDVAHVCGVDLTVLLSGSPARLSGYSVVRKGQGLSVQRRKDYDYWSLAANFTGRGMEPFLVKVPSKTPEQLTFTSHKGEEFIYILEGRLELTLDKKVEVLAAGDSIYFSSRIPHALRGLDEKDVLFVDVIR